MQSREQVITSVNSTNAIGSRYNGEVGSSDLITTITVPSAGLPAITDVTIIVVLAELYRRWEARPDG